MDLKEQIEKQNADLKRKRDALKKMLDKKMELVDGLPETREQYDKIMGSLEKLTEDIKKEVAAIESDIRKYRFVDYGEWWNLWVGGWLAAAVVDIFGVRLDPQASRHAQQSRRAGQDSREADHERRQARQVITRTALKAGAWAPD